jgi:spore germination protein Q
MYQPYNPTMNTGKSGAPAVQGVSEMPGKSGMPGVQGVSEVPGKTGTSGMPGMLGMPGTSGMPGMPGMNIPGMPGMGMGMGTGMPGMGMGAGMPGMGMGTPGSVMGMMGGPGMPPSGDLTVPGSNILGGELSYIENILRMNLGKTGTFYMTYENNSQWNAKIFKGVLEAAGRDHIIISDPSTGMRILLLMVNLDYATFDQPLTYTYPGVIGNPPQRKPK